MSKLKRVAPLLIFLFVIAFVLLYPKILAKTTPHGAFQQSIDYTDKTYDLKIPALESEEAVAFAKAKLLPTNPTPTFYVLTYNDNRNHAYYVSNVKISGKDMDKLEMGSPYPIKTGTKDAYNAAMEEVIASGFSIRYSDEQVTIYEKSYDGSEFTLGGITYLPEYFLYGTPMELNR